VQVCRALNRGLHDLQREQSPPKGHAEQSMKKAPIDSVPGEVSVADVTERLMLEFGAVLPLADVSHAVLQSFKDLAAAPIGALPELVERLARQRLHEAAVARGERPTR
jgi:hypothetical protein